MTVPYIIKQLLRLSVIFITICVNPVILDLIFQFALVAILLPPTPYRDHSEHNSVMESKRTGMKDPGCRRYLRLSRCSCFDL